MKKIILSAFLSFSFYGISHAQNQVYRVMNMHHTLDYNDDTEISEGDVIVFNTAEYTPAKLNFLTYNDSGENIFLQVECEGITNTDGSKMELCYGECYNGIDTFVGYPILPQMLGPNQHQPIINDYFSNTDSDSDLVEYNFRFYQLNSDGVEIPNTSLRFTYRYDKNAMSVSDLNSRAIAEIYPTVTRGSTTVELKEAARVQIINMEGKSVQTLKLNAGKSNLDLSGFTAGVYLIQFKGNSGLTTTKKIVVK